MTAITLQNNRVLSLTASVLDAHGDPIDGSAVSWEIRPLSTVADIIQTDTGCTITPRHNDTGLITVVATHTTAGAPLIEEIQVEIVAPVPTAIRITSQID